MPDIVRALASGQPVSLRHPSATRPWQHVLDPLYGYLLLARALYEEPSRYEGPWNFGPDPSEVIEVRELARRVHRHWGKGSWIEAAEPTGIAEAEMLSLDSSKSERALGWRPAFGIERAIDLTVDWYRRVIDHGEDPLRVTEEQIAALDAQYESRSARASKRAKRQGTS